ncbi:hypothetical protein GCM10010519_04960 [Streptomyces lactacystinicus]
MGAAGPRTPRRRPHRPQVGWVGGGPGRKVGRGRRSDRTRQLEARVAELETNERKLATERDILRRAAKYFAGETNW